MTPGPWLGPSPASGALPSSSDTRPPLNYLVLVSTHFSIANTSILLKGMGDRTVVTRPSLGRWKRLFSEVVEPKGELNAVPLVLSKPKRCKGVFSFNPYTTVPSSSAGDLFFRNSYAQMYAAIS